MGGSSSKEKARSGKRASNGQLLPADAVSIIADFAGEILEVLLALAMVNRTWFDGVSTAHAAWERLRWSDLSLTYARFWRVDHAFCGVPVELQRDGLVLMIRKRLEIEPRCPIKICNTYSQHTATHTNEINGAFLPRQIDNLRRHLKHARHLSFALGNGLTDAMLVEACDALVKLESLDLTFQSRITDAALQHLSSTRSSSLRNLSVETCYLISKRGFEAIGQLLRLRVLHVSGCRHFNDEACAVIAKLPVLGELRFSYCVNVGVPGLTALADGLGDKLRVLHMASFALGDEGASVIARFSNLESLNIANYSGLNPAGLVSLAPLTKLRTLSLFSISTVSFNYVKTFLTANPLLESLNIGKLWCSAPDLAAIVDEHPNLQSLVIRGCLGFVGSASLVAQMLPTVVGFVQRPHFQSLVVADEVMLEALRKHTSATVRAHIAAGRISF